MRFLGGKIALAILLAIAGVPGGLFVNAVPASIRSGNTGPTQKSTPTVSYELAARETEAVNVRQHGRSTFVDTCTPKCVKSCFKTKNKKKKRKRRKRPTTQQRICAAKFVQNNCNGLSIQRKKLLVFRCLKVGMARSQDPVGVPLAATFVNKTWVQGNTNETGNEVLAPWNGVDSHNVSYRVQIAKFGMVSLLRASTLIDSIECQKKQGGAVGRVRIVYNKALPENNNENPLNKMFPKRSILAVPNSSKFGRCSLKSGEESGGYLIIESVTREVNNKKTVVVTGTPVSYSSIFQQADLHYHRIPTTKTKTKRHGKNPHYRSQKFTKAFEPIKGVLRLQASATVFIDAMDVGDFDVEISPQYSCHIPLVYDARASVHMNMSVVAPTPHKELVKWEDDWIDIPVWAVPMPTGLMNLLFDEYTLPQDAKPELGVFLKFPIFLRGSVKLATTLDVAMEYSVDMGRKDIVFEMDSDLVPRITFNNNTNSRILRPLKPFDIVVGDPKAEVTLNAFGGLLPTLALELAGIGSADIAFPAGPTMKVPTKTGGALGRPYAPTNTSKWNLNVCDKCHYHEIDMGLKLGGSSVEVEIEDFKKDWDILEDEEYSLDVVTACWDAAENYTACNDVCCSPGYECVNNKCQNKTNPGPDPKPINCTKNEDCLKGYECVDHKCQNKTNPGPDPKPVNCTKNEDCLKGYECIDNKCQNKTKPDPDPKPVNCTKNEDCLKGYECVDNKCQNKTKPDPDPKPINCTKDENCSNVTVNMCTPDGKCHLRDEIECTNDEACHNASKFKCELSTYKCVLRDCKVDNNTKIECCGDKDCASGQKCVSNFCVNDGNPRFTLSWFGDDDLDLYVKTPGGFVISYNATYDNVTGGKLDRDSKPVESTPLGGDPIRHWTENVAFPVNGSWPSGTYEYWVRNKDQRGNVSDIWMLESHWWNNSQDQGDQHHGRTGNGLESKHFWLLVRK